MKAENWTNYEDRLTRVTAYVYDHLHEDLNLQTLADVAALSPYHWHRIYHSIRGETIAATVRRLRLQRAAADLAQTARTVEDIAVRAGYGGAQAFTRAFSDAYALPPATYREQGSHSDFKPGQLDAPRGSWSIKTRRVPAIQMLSIEHRGPYLTIGKSFEALFGRAGAQNLLPSNIRMVGIFYDDPTIVPEDKLCSRAAIEATKTTEVIPPLERVEIKGGDYAILRHKGPYADMRAAYLWLFGTWLPQSGREAADAPVFEDYLNSPSQTPPSELLTDMYLPLLEK
jgi:AraC family transcriptional regulator